MSAAIIPFSRRVAVYPGGPATGETAPARALDAGATHIPADLEALVASHAEDLRMGSILDVVDDLIERATDERAGYAHRPLGVIADIALDGLLKVKADLDATVRSLAARTALAEARELDRELSDLDLTGALEIWRELTPAQQGAVIWVQSEAMTPGGAA